MYKLYIKEIKPNLKTKLLLEYADELLHHDIDSALSAGLAAGCGNIAIIFDNNKDP